MSSTQDAIGSPAGSSLSTGPALAHDIAEHAAPELEAVPNDTLTADVTEPTTKRFLKIEDISMC